MSEKVLSAANQQGSLYQKDPSETIRRTPISQKEIIAYLLGALHDGTLNKGKRFRISQKDKRWLEKLKALLKQIGYNSWIYREGKHREVFVLETLASFLDFSFDPLVLKSQKEQMSYVKGFFDAEGGMPHNALSRFYIQLVQNDKNKLECIKAILERLSIECGKIHNPSKNVAPNYWRVYVLARSHISFAMKINSWHPRKKQIFRERMMI